MSVICDFIKNNPDSWEQECESRKVRVKRDIELPYAIFNYEIMADFSDPVVQEARGIIIDLERLEPVCWPFRKFGNFSESYADNIDWDTARVQDKIDGSLIKLWYSERAGEWIWSTNACIRASEASADSGRVFQNIIESTPEYAFISSLQKDDKLDKDLTYMFELVGPDNQVVIRYPESALWHIGTRNTRTGKEENIDIGIQKPKEYPLHSLDECKKAAEKLNKGDYPDAEGYVVVDREWHRVKVKSPEYLIWHHAVNNGNINKESAYELIHSDDFDMETFKENVSEYVFKKVEYYNQAFQQSEAKCVDIIERARQMNADGMSRKEIALAIKDSPYSAYGFKGLDSNLDAIELIAKLGAKMFIKTVEDYREGIECSQEKEQTPKKGIPNEVAAQDINDIINENDAEIDENNNITVRSVSRDDDAIR